MRHWKTLRECKHLAQALVVQGAFGALSCLPDAARARFASWLFRGAGKLRLNRLAMKNLDYAYGESIPKSQKREIIKKIYGNLGRTLSEMTRIRKGDLDYVASMVEGRDAAAKIREVLDRGRGIVCVTPHFGNWEFFPGWMKIQGFPSSAVGKRQRNRILNEQVVQMRRDIGTEVIYYDESPRRMLRALKENRVLGLMPDADTARLDGIFVDFFGRPTYTPTGPASLAILGRTPILPLFLVFENGRYRVVAEPAIEPSQESRSEEELRRLTKHWSDAFERQIRLHPDHWMWFQRRWTTTPENAERKRERRRAVRGRGSGSP